MSFRYSEREIEFFDSMVITARRVARMGGAPIDPDKTDYEAIEFLLYLESMASDYTDLAYQDDLAFEVADASVPYNDYKAAMAWSQLGLYQLDETMSLDGMEIMGRIKVGLYEFGRNYVEAYGDENQ